MDLQLSSLEKAPRSLPIWERLLEDLGNPGTDRIAKVLGVGTSTVYRWERDGKVPRVACLALFWLTRWGRSQIDAQATNDARLTAELARTLADDNRRLEARAARAVVALRRAERLIRQEGARSQAIFWLQKAIDAAEDDDLGMPPEALETRSQSQIETEWKVSLHPSMENPAPPRSALEAASLRSSLALRPDPYGASASAERGGAEQPAAEDPRNAGALPNWQSTESVTTPFRSEAAPRPPAAMVREAVRIHRCSGPEAGHRRGAASRASAGAAPLDDDAERARQLAGSRASEAAAGLPDALRDSLRSGRGPGSQAARYLGSHLPNADAQGAGRRPPGALPQTPAGASPPPPMRR